MTSPAPDLATNLRVATLRLSRRLRRELVSSCTESQYAVLAALVHVGRSARATSPTASASRHRR